MAASPDKVIKLFVSDERGADKDDDEDGDGEGEKVSNDKEEETGPAGTVACTQSTQIEMLHTMQPSFMSPRILFLVKHLVQCHQECVPCVWWTRDK